MKNKFVVSVAQMRELDQLTIERKGITSFRLMKHAGSCLASYVLKNGLIVKGQRTLIVAGTGNNGGDGMVIASILYQKGYDVSVVLVGSEKSQSEQSKVIWNEIKELGINFNVVDDIDHLESVIQEFVIVDVIIDSIFGIGLTRDVEGYYKGIVSMINQSNASVISIDIPSGVNADNGLICGVSVEANHTLVVQHYKQGNLLGDARDVSGKTHLIDAGIESPTRQVQELISIDEIKILGMNRKHNTHKYHYGSVLTLGGSKGMMGAPILSGISALKTGSGISRVLYHDKYLINIQNPYPSIMIDTYKEIKEYNFSKISSIVFGPGLGRNDDYNIVVLEQLLQLQTPIVIDADGIYYLKEITEAIGANHNILITPHYGEMAMLIDITSKEVAKDPVRYAKETAIHYGVVVLLKGATTIITDGISTYFSNHGNPGMATAGSGDVLSGILGSLLGKGIDVLVAAKLGVLIHSIAANFAAIEFGEESLIATDIIDNIHRVLK